MFANCNSRPDVRLYGAGGATVGAPVVHQQHTPWQQQHPTPMYNAKHHQQQQQQQSPHSAVQLDNNHFSRPSLPPNFRNVHSQQDQCVRPGFGPQQQQQQQNGNFNGGSQVTGVSFQFANTGQHNSQWSFNGTQQQQPLCPQAAGGSFGAQQGHQSQVPHSLSSLNVTQEQTALLLPVPVAAYVQSQLARLLAEGPKNQSINLTSQPPPGYIRFGDNCVSLSQLLPPDMKPSEAKAAVETEKSQSPSANSDKATANRAKIGQLKEEDWEYLRSIQTSDPPKPKADMTSTPPKEKPRSRFSDAPPPPADPNRDLPADPRLLPRSRSRRDNHKESRKDSPKRRDRSRERSRDRSPVHSKRPPKTVHIDASLESNTKPPFWNRHLNITVQCYASRALFPPEITEKDPRYVFYCANVPTYESETTSEQSNPAATAQSELTSSPERLTKRSRFT